jgi:hypothetical protein
MNRALPGTWLRFNENFRGQDENTFAARNNE